MKIKLNKLNAVLFSVGIILSGCNSGGGSTVEATTNSTTAQSTLKMQALAKKLHASSLANESEPVPFFELISSEDRIKPGLLKAGVNYQPIDTSIKSTRIKLGYGYSSLLGMPVDNSLFKSSVPLIKSATKYTSTTLIDATSSDVSKTLSVAVDANVKGLQYDVSAGMRYISSIASTKNSLVISVAAGNVGTATIDVQDGAESYLTADFTALRSGCAEEIAGSMDKKNSARLCQYLFWSQYGSKYINSADISQWLFLTYRINFASEKEKSEMSAYLKAKVEGVTDGGSISASIAKAVSEENAHVSISLETTQIGGKPASTPTNISSNMLNCAMALTQGSVSSSCELVGKSFDQMVISFQQNNQEIKSANGSTLASINSSYIVSPLNDNISQYPLSVRKGFTYSSLDPFYMDGQRKISEAGINNHNEVYEDYKKYVSYANMLNDYLDTSTPNPLAQNIDPASRLTLNNQADTLRRYVAFFNGDHFKSGSNYDYNIFHTCYNEANIEFSLNPDVAEEQAGHTCADFIQNLHILEAKYPLDTNSMRHIKDDVFSVHSRAATGGSADKSTEYMLVPRTAESTANNGYSLVTNNNGVYFIQNSVDMKFSSGVIGNGEPSSEAWLSLNITGTQLNNQFFKDDKAGKPHVDANGKTLNYAEYLQTQLQVDGLNYTTVASTDCSSGSSQDSTNSVYFYLQTLDNLSPNLPGCHLEKDASGKMLWDCTGAITTGWDNGNSATAHCAWVPYIMKQKFEQIIPAETNIFFKTNNSLAS